MAIDKLNAAKIYGLDNKPDVLDTYFNRDKSLSEIELITKNKKLNRELNSAYEQLEIYEKQLDKALLEIDKLNEELSEIKR